jgi:hypothetical protein
MQRLTSVEIDHYEEMVQAARKLPTDAARESFLRANLKLGEEYIHSAIANSEDDDDLTSKPEVNRMIRVFALKTKEMLGDYFQEYGPLMGTLRERAIAALAYDSNETAAQRHAKFRQLTIIIRKETTFADWVLEKLRAEFGNSGAAALEALRYLSLIRLLSTMRSS